MYLARLSWGESGNTLSGGEERESGNTLSGGEERVWQHSLRGEERESGNTLSGGGESLVTLSQGGGESLGERVR